MARGMMRRRCALVFVLAAAVLASAADDAAGTVAKDVARCRGAIVTGGAAYVQARTKALGKCERAIENGALPHGTNCRVDVKTGATLAKIGTKLHAVVGKGCGGKDKICGTADDESLAAIGWNIGHCPNFESGSCANAVADCDSIAACLECIAGSAVDESVALSADALIPSDPKMEKALHKCQLTIGKASGNFLSAKSKILAKCWSTVNKAGAGACPDAKAATAMVAAAHKRDAAVLKACGGADGTVGTADDFPPSQIGFPAQCTGPTVPACALAVGTLAELVTCVDCVAERDADCADRAAVPAFVAPYPTTCNSGGSVTRPATVHVPPGYTPGVAMPLVILLHGYGASGALQEAYFALTPLSDARGFLYTYPDGTLDSSGHRFWNATDACCDFDGSDVDDFGYLAGLIDEISSNYTVDPKRIFVIGYSNGGFMAYRMACDHADEIAAVVSMAGAMTADVATCTPAAPVGILEIHGTSDASIPYAGGSGNGHAFPGAVTTVNDWVTLDACSAIADAGVPPLDLDAGIAGAETTVTRYGTSCAPGGHAELWTINGGVHVPTLSQAFASDVIDFLLAHPKP